MISEGSKNIFSNTVLKDHDTIVQAQRKITEALTALAAKRKEEEDAKQHAVVDKAVAEKTAAEATNHAAATANGRRKRHF